MTKRKSTNTGSFSPPSEGSGEGSGEAISFYDNVYEVVHLIPPGKVTATEQLLHFLDRRNPQGWLAGR